MSESKHTPGPWGYQREVSTKVFGGAKNSIIKFEIYKQDGVYAHPATCDNEHDARLIAAAPELLSELKRTLSTVNETGGLVMEDFHRIQAVIAKAERGEE